VLSIIIFSIIFTISAQKEKSIKGEIKRDLEMKPQENKQIIFTYSVKYPKDKVIILE
jgi:hypothetical protein